MYVSISSVLYSARKSCLTHNVQKMRSKHNFASDTSCKYLTLLSSSFHPPGVMKEELNSVNMKESLSKLTDHSSSKLASQASSILAILGDTS